MVTIKNEIITLLRNTAISYNPEIRDFYSTKPITYPLVAVDELDNLDSIKYLDKTYYSELTYTIEIYNKDMVGAYNTLVSKNDVSFAIANDVDAALKSQYGLTRVGTPAKILLDDDNTVLRTVLTYRCTIDNEHEITYR